MHHIWEHIGRHCHRENRFENRYGRPQDERYEAARFGMEREMDPAGLRRGGGRRRMFDGGELRLVLLKLIGDQPRHGYDLIRAVEERTGGAYSPSPGVVYPTITLLADMGLIGEQETPGARKLFAITPEGTAHLDERAEDVAAIFARLDALGAMRERTDAVPIRRAMHNLRSVLEHRLAEGLGKDLMHDAVALIDEAARKIERL
jgi:DNA-binding PadR family transcriptional regulator